MVIEDQLLQATVYPSQHAEHNELRNHTLNVKACYEGKGCLQTLTALSCSRPQGLGEHTNIWKTQAGRQRAISE